MTAIRKTLISCDGCGEIFASSDCRNGTSAQQRKSFRDEGWHRYKGMDYCESCWQHEKQLRAVGKVQDERKVQRALTRHDQGRAQLLHPERLMRGTGERRAGK